MSTAVVVALCDTGIRWALLFEDIEKKNVPEVKSLISKFPKAVHARDDDDNIPLHTAIEKPHFDIIYRLVEKQPDP